MIPNPYQGKFIVIDSLDGSGQTTQIDLIERYFLERGISYWRTKEPTRSNEFGIRINRILDKVEEAPDPKTLQELFSYDRGIHQKEIIEHLKKGEFVISDRYFPSTYVYGGAQGVDLGYLEKLNSYFIEPDLTIILKVSPKTAIERISKRGMEKKLFEKEDFLFRVWQFYEEFARIHKNVYIIDGEKNPKEVFVEVKKLIEDKFFKNKI